MAQALLVIDVQEIYTNPSLGLYCENADKTVMNINRLIERFHHTGQIVIYIKHSHKADRSDLGHMFDFAGPTDIVDFIAGTRDVEFSRDLTVSSESIILHKNRYSSFHNTDLEKVLRENNVERVVICGFMTNFCCESTARDAHDRDFFVDYIVDATGTPGVDNMDQTTVRSAVTNMLAAGFATIITTDDYLSA